MCDKAALLPLTVSVLQLIAQLMKHKRKKRKRSRKQRRWRVRPMLQLRNGKGHFHTLYSFIKDNDDEQFSKYTRMSVDQFNTLLEIVGPRLHKNSLRQALSPEHRLVITLYYLPHGSSMQLTAWSFYVAKSTVSNMVRETCQVIWDTLSPIYVKSPDSQEDWRMIADEFYRRWNFPNCLGAMDGKHITIQAPNKSGSQYFHYKKSFSIILLAVCDANYTFTMVDVGAFSSQSGGGVFKETVFGKALDQNALDVPESTSLPGTNTRFPYFFVADEAFPLKNYIMRPYPGTHLGRPQQIFNYRLSRARRIIENSFGLLSSQRRVLRSNIIADVKTVERIVCATIALHNYIKNTENNKPDQAQYYCPSYYVDTYDSDGNVIPGEWRRTYPADSFNNIGRMGSNHPARSATNQRDILSNYLSSPESEVPWQYDYIDRGMVI